MKLGVFSVLLGGKTLEETLQYFAEDDFHLSIMNS